MVVALDEILQILETHRLLFQRVMHIGAVVVVPDLLRQRVWVRLPVIEEDHIRLHARLVEYSSRQPQDRVEVRTFQQLLTNRLAHATFK